MPDDYSSSRSAYLTVATLAALVRLSRRQKRVSDELGAALMQIAGGVWDRYRFTADRDEFVQDCMVHLLGTPLKKCDPRQHVFNYFTTCVIRFGGKLREKPAAERRRFEAFARDRLDMREIPVPHRHDGNDFED